MVAPSLVGPMAAGFPVAVLSTSWDAHWIARAELAKQAREQAADKYLIPALRHCVAARNASLFGVADFYSRNFAIAGHAAAEIHVNNPWLQSAWAREHGMAVAPVDPPGSAARAQPLPGWLQRAVTPFKPLLRPLARRVGLSPKLDAQAENILLAQIEDFRPDLVLNQDTFHVDTKLMRRIKQIGNPTLIGQIGIAPSRGEDWAVDEKPRDVHRCAASV